MCSKKRQVHDCKTTVISFVIISVGSLTSKNIMIACCIVEHSLALKHHDCPHLHCLDIKARSAVNVTV